MLLFQVLGTGRISPDIRGRPLSLRPDPTCSPPRHRPSVAVLEGIRSTSAAAAAAAARNEETAPVQGRAGGGGSWPITGWKLLEGGGAQVRVFRYSSGERC